MKILIQFALLCFASMLPLTACSGTLTVEPDEHDPNLHGQVVQFTVPVVYMEFIEEDSKGFSQKSLNIGRLLVRDNDAHSLFDRKNTHVIKQVPIRMSFAIIESYGVLHDWFTREFAPDRDMVVLKDENGVESVTFRSLLIDTDKSELGKNER